MSTENSVMVDDHEEDERPLSTKEQMTKLIGRAREAQDLCGWADPTVRDGQMQLAAGALELSRVMVETLMILRSTIEGE